MLDLDTVQMAKSLDKWIDTVEASIIMKDGDGYYIPTPTEILYDDGVVYLKDLDPDGMTIIK